MVERRSGSAGLRSAEAGTVSPRRRQRFQEKHNQADAFHTAKARARARSTGKRHRLVDEDGHLLDLLER